MGERDPEGGLVASLVAEVGDRGKRTAYVALQALHTIARDAWRDRVATALTQAPTEPPAPAWAGQGGSTLPPTPERAQLWSDPWGSATVHLLRYAVPSPHVVIVPITTVGGTFVQSIVVEQDADPDEKIDAMTLRGEVEVDDALAAIADGLFHTDMYWPPQEDPGYVVNRAYVHWLTEGHRAEVEWEGLTDDERHDLIHAFQREHGATLAHDATTIELLADTFVDFGDGYLAGGVLAWSPGEVERFLLGWAQRKVILDAQDIAALPDVLRAWVGFALRRQGLAEVDIEPVVAAVDEFGGDYLRDVGSAPKGPAAELMARAMADGIDLDDQDALDRLVGAYNAEQNARRLLDS